MITAVDSNILIDVLIQDSAWGEGSHQALIRAAAEGALVIHEMVVAEIASCFATPAELRESLEEVPIPVAQSSLEAAFAAGQAHQKYRGQGGRRERVLADFIIGAHASLSADRLLTRDRGYYLSDLLSRLTAPGALRAGWSRSLFSVPCGPESVAFQPILTPVAGKK
ncbi:type II toxin-antitoxin system VapC family toxin [Acidobacteria bacterium AH-259-D05]|nr:type II toxin-antitoxin system VapC family toxin [Acidobacteria bacterium AH-259-D05]